MVRTDETRSLLLWLFILAAGLLACRSAAHGDSAPRAGPSATSIALTPHAASATARAPTPLLAAASADVPAQHPEPAGDSIEQQLQAMGYDVDQVRQFLGKVKAFVSQNDRAHLCSLAHYPLVVNSRTGRRKIRDEAACQRDYATILSQPIVDAVKKQRFEDLGVVSQGVMIGDGDVWLSRPCSDPTCEHPDLRIVTINQ